jgi:hypothetical protein
LLVIKYYLHDKVKGDEMDGVHRLHGDLIEIYEVLFGKSERDLDMEG